MAVNPYYKEKNMINLSAGDLSRPVYRIMPMKHLRLMLQKKTLALAKTSSWEDTYENFFYKEKFFLGGKPVTMEHLGLIVFGQCWSLFRDSDALWRIYSPDKKSVRIRTTVGKLYDAVYTDDACMASTYIGAVNYVSKRELSDWIDRQNPVSTGTIGRTLVDSLFLKRRNFSHEREVRIVYMPDMGSTDCGGLLKTYPVDPSDLIDEITFDPRADDRFVTSSQSAISKCGFPLSRVSKSPLYDFRSVNIQIL